MKRKVFISFLGFTDYWPCEYEKGDYKSASVRYVQEATLDYLNKLQPWTDDDVALILLTEGAEKANWNDNGHKDKNGDIKRQTGLRSQLEAMKLPIQICPVTQLPNGNNEKDILDIFTRVFKLLNAGDELYFDITHGFRSLPMLAIVLGNYAKFLKSVVVKHISYGQYDPQTKKAELVNMLPLSSIQDWTFAAANFLENGNVNQLASLSETVYRALLKETKGKDEDARKLRVFTENLRNVSYDFQTCRGMNIVNSTNISPLKKSIDDLQRSVIEPLNPVIKKIENAMLSFDDKQNVLNGFSAAKWCLNHGLFQQAATILQENVVTYFCFRHNIRIDDEDKRELINKAMNILFYAEKNWKVDDENRTKLSEVVSDEILKDNDLVCGFKNLTEVRNDLNHSGMRSKDIPLSPQKIRKNIEKCVKLFEEKLC